MAKLARSPSRYRCWQVGGIWLNQRTEGHTLVFKQSVIHNDLHFFQLYQHCIVGRRVIRSIISSSVAVNDSALSIRYVACSIINSAVLNDAFDSAL